MIFVHTWEATEKFLSALLAPLKQNADLENMLKVTKWVETTVIFGGTARYRSAIVHAFVSSPLHGHSSLSTKYEGGEGVGNFVDSFLQF